VKYPESNYGKLWCCCCSMEHSP